MNFPRTFFAVLLLAGAAAAGEAAERRYSIGVHDSVVPDADSHTYGITGALPILHWDDDLLIRLSFTAMR